MEAFPLLLCMINSSANTTFSSFMDLKDKPYLLCITGTGYKACSGRDATAVFGRFRFGRQETGSSLCCRPSFDFAWEPSWRKHMGNSPSPAQAHPDCKATGIFCFPFQELILSHNWSATLPRRELHSWAVLCLPFLFKSDVWESC